MRAGSAPLLPRGALVGYIGSMDAFALATRTGLPDALRVLAEAYPRPGWEAHPHFNALVRFWLDRHLMFRRLQATLLTEAEAQLDQARDPERFGADLARTAGTFLNELHGHHHVEDAHYFPLLTRLEPRLEAGFALHDRDHRDLDPALHGLAARTNAVLRAIRANAPAGEVGRLHADLERFQRFLDRHLTDEEEIVVPVILANQGAGLD